MKYLIVILAILLCVVLAGGAYILFLRYRAKKALWYRVRGTVVGQKKSILPGMIHWIVFVQDPFSQKKIVVKTCFWSKRTKPSNKVSYDLMLYKKGKKTIRILYPANRKHS